MTKVTQSGTGLHLDCNPYDIWRTEQGTNGASFYSDLEWFRPFQSFVALTDASGDRERKDGGLELVPGFYSVCTTYFDQKLIGLGPDDEKPGRNLDRWGPYVARFTRGVDDWILDQIVKAQRIPDDWQLPMQQNGAAAAAPPATAHECLLYCKSIAREHRSLTFKPIEAGDFVLWDMRTPHQNSESNDTNTVRSVFYHAYMVAEPSEINEARIALYANYRLKLRHTPDFASKWADLERDGEVLPLDTKLAKALYNEIEWNELDQPLQQNGNVVSDIDQLIGNYGQLLTDRHIAFFKRFGYVVVEGAMPRQQATKLYNEAIQFCKKKGCDLLDPSSLGAKEYERIASQFGGTVELFYLEEQQRIRLDETMYAITAKLGAETWNTNQGPFTHPFTNQNFDSRKLWLYIDRMNIRLPTSWLTDTGGASQKKANGNRGSSSSKKGSKRK